MDQNDLPLLLQFLRNNPSLGGPVFSDTPGMGNAAPFQFPGASRSDFSNSPAQMMPPGMSVPMNSRIDLEKMLMNKRLSDWINALQRNRDLYKLNEQDRFNQPGQRWDVMPNNYRMGRFM